MAVYLLILLAALLFKHDYLGRAAMTDYGGSDRAAAEFQVLAFALQKRFEFNRIADLSRDRRHFYNVAFVDSKLLATRLNDSVCHSKLPPKKYL